MSYHDPDFAVVDGIEQIFTIPGFRIRFINLPHRVIVAENDTHEQMNVLKYFFPRFAFWWNFPEGFREYIEDPEWGTHRHEFAQHIRDRMSDEQRRMLTRMQRRIKMHYRKWREPHDHPDWVDQRYAIRNTAALNEREHKRWLRDNR